MTEDHFLLMGAGSRQATTLAFDFARRALRAAEIQNRRIWNAPVVEGQPGVVIEAIQDILIDVHFYFVALRNVYRFLSKVVEDPDFAHFVPNLELLNQQWFAHYSTGREAFEHIDQRLPGERHSPRIAETMTDGTSRRVHYGLNLRQGVFRHSDQEWDIRPETFSRLHGDVSALLEAILDDARKRQMSRGGQT